MTTLTEVIEICQTKLTDTSSGEARRLFHGRGHCYPGYEHLVITLLTPCLHIALFDDMPAIDLDALIDSLVAQQPGITGVAVQRRQGRSTTTEVWRGEVEGELLVKEHGLSYWVSPLKNQNIGLFLDMGHVRERLTPYMQKANVLNLFAYTCAFSVSALAQDARQVVNNDMSRNALKQGEQNHLANDQDLRQVRMIAQDVFKSWKRIRGLAPYDVVILDPPTNQRGSFTAEKDYAQVLKRLDSVTKSGSILVACLNSPFLPADFLDNQLARWASNFVFVETLPAHPDFPEQYPDRGLKVQIYRRR